jgi:hypothetical protein
MHYVGLDVSLKQTSICAVSETGSVVREGVVDSKPEGKVGLRAVTNSHRTIPIARSRFWIKTVLLTFAETLP